MKITIHKLALSLDKFEEMVSWLKRCPFELEVELDYGVSIKKLEAQKKP